jgi:nitrate/nitrite transporter NarK
VISFFVLYDFPETATFLTAEERAFVVYRLKYQGQVENDTNDQRVAEAEEFRWSYVKAAFLDWQIWISVIVYWGIVCPLYGIALFLPSIIKALGYTSATAQLLTVPIYITAAILAVAFAWLSDRAGKRSPFILAFLFMMAIGFIMSVSHDGFVVEQLLIRRTGASLLLNQVSYMLEFSLPLVLFIQLFPVSSLSIKFTSSLTNNIEGNITWLSNNLSGSYKRSAGMALQIGVGNLAGGDNSIFLGCGKKTDMVYSNGV